MKVTVLIDNIATDGLVQEWGLSVLAEYGGKAVLLDTGASKRFLDNAQRLEADLSQVDYGVLSHTHYDHADGMEAFFRVNQKADFYIREGGGENCYFRWFVFSKYIGIAKGMLEKWHDRIRYVKGDYQLDEGIWLIPHKTPGLDQIGRKNHMYVKRDRQWMADDFSHEQSLVFAAKEGLVICNSCSHGGAGNIIREVQATFPNHKICAIIGGFHLYQTSENEVRKLADEIRSTGIERVYTGHCTGDKAYAILQEELGSCLTQIRTGMVITFEE